MRRRSNHDTTHLLRWFFQEAAGDVSGLRSSWEALWEMAQSGAVRQGAAGRSRTPTPRQLRSAGMESDIAARLEQLEPLHQAVLRLAHGDGWPLPPSEDEDDRREHKVVYSRRAAQQREDKKRLGDHPPVALLTEAAQQAWHRRTSYSGNYDGFTDWLRTAPLGEDLLKQIREESAGLVKAADKAWEAVAPPAREDGSLIHNRRRRAAYGPTERQDGHRPSGVYPKYEPEPMPSVRAVGSREGF